MQNAGLILNSESEFHHDLHPKPAVVHPGLQRNEIGLTRRDYEGSMTTLVRRLRTRLDHRGHRAGVLGTVDSAAPRRQALRHRLFVEDAGVLPERGARIQRRPWTHAGARDRRQRRQQRADLHRRVRRRRLAVDRARPALARDPAQREPALRPREQRRLRPDERAVLRVGRPRLAQQEGRGQHDGVDRRLPAGADAWRQLRRAQLLGRQGAARADPQGRPCAQRLRLHRRDLAVRDVQRSRGLDQELRVHPRAQRGDRAGRFRSARNGDHHRLRRGERAERDVARRQLGAPAQDRRGLRSQRPRSRLRLHPRAPEATARS